jgi:hypothetical protein
MAFVQRFAVLDFLDQPAVCADKFIRTPSEGVTLNSQE